MERGGARGRTSESLREKHSCLEQEVLQYREEVTSLQEQLDSVTKEFDMSVEDLSETLLQIKAFRLQREGEEKLHSLGADGKVEDCSRELMSLQASHAETTVMERSETEREESRRRIAMKDNLLEKRAQRIITLQVQLKELAYSPKNYKRTIPPQYAWAGGDGEAAEHAEEDAMFLQLRGGESLLEVHLRGAVFTPGGLRTMGRGQEVVTFCTYVLLDFETHSTPLVSGPQPNYGFTSRYPLSSLDLGEVKGHGGRVRVEVHQALGLEGEVMGVLEYWVRLYPPVELMDTLMDRQPGRLTDRCKPYPVPPLHALTREETVTERCVGLSARWAGLLPDAYLLYRLYDLPPHTSPTIPCSADPVFADMVSYPLAVSTDLLEYLRCGSLWVYAFDDSDRQNPASYMAKTPIPLQALAQGQPIRGDYVLRDTVGCPRGTVRVSLRWKYPFQPPEALLSRRGATNVEREKDRTKTPERPVAKPRSKAVVPKPVTPTMHRETQTQGPPIRVRGRQRATPLKSAKLLKTKPHPSPDQATPLLTPEPAQDMPFQSPARKRATPLRSPEQHQATPVWSPVRERKTPRPPSAPPLRSPHLQPKTQEVRSPEEEVEDLVLEGVEDEQEDDRSERAPLDSEVSITESSESAASSGSDVIIIPRPPRALKKGNKLTVEILSLSFDPTSHVALDQSVQRVYVEYRLLGVPMETTETPMSLRKPTAGEEIHYNFTRVVAVGEDAVVGKLRVSLEAAQTLRGIYWEQRSLRETQEAPEEEKEEGKQEEEEEGEEDLERAKKEETQDEDDDFF
ncbi:hypothetical protein JZ751_011491 [Albula glossodonta]|uniref:Uncharacterized protein n=1 Tax=Albula glossodonta TaxID=121402 RepID=A0A8T2MJY0_9TELE|nr:hypothetical protein JZ751_011491 [Albula glossodonta]